MAKRLSMRLEYQKCRNWRHAWDDFIPLDRTTHPTIYESPHQETLRCLRCETERYRGIGFTGEVESSYYSYPDGYLEDADSKPELVAIRLSVIGVIKAAAAQSKRSRSHRTAARHPVKKATPKKVTPRKGTARRPTARRQKARARA